MTLFPLLPERHAAEGARLYKGLGTTVEQIGFIMGEGEVVFQILADPLY